MKYIFILLATTNSSHSKQQEEKRERREEAKFFHNQENFLFHGYFVSELSNIRIPQNLKLNPPLYEMIKSSLLA